MAMEKKSHACKLISSPDFFPPSSISNFPATKRVLKDGKTPSPSFMTKKDELLLTLPRYFDASASHAHHVATDGPGEDSDLKWLQVVRGEREGVAKMAGRDLNHLEQIRDEARREEARKRKADGQDKMRMQWEEEKVSVMSRAKLIRGIEV